jgi:hypothetical protein
MSTITPEMLARMQTRQTADWIAKITAANPAKLLPSGNILLPPARGAFVNFAKPGEDKVVKGVLQKGKFGGALLFAPGADLTAARDLRAERIKEYFPKNPQGLGLDDPIKDQGIRVSPEEGGSNKMGKTTSGYVPGNLFMNPNANVDYRPRLNRLEGGQPVPAFGTEEELVKEFYSGAWYMATVSVFHGKNDQNPNAFYGLASVLKIADDNVFSGGGGDGVEAFAGIQIDDGVDPASLFA